METATPRDGRRDPNAWRRWLAFAAWAALILAATPVANDVQKWIRGRIGASSLRYALTALLLALTAALILWLIRRRLDSPWRRLLWLLGLAAAALAATWRLEVEAEPAHLAAYAVLGGLAFRALAVRFPDAGVYPAAGALTALVGTFDEVVQWLLPNRFWGLSDVGLNVFAGILAQLLIRKVVRPAGISPGAGAGSRRLAVRLVACEVALLALCLANTPVRIEGYASRLPGLGYLGQQRSTRMTEYGHLYLDPAIGRFRSRLAPDDLRRVDGGRGAEAAVVLARLGRPMSYDDFQRTYRPSLDPFLFEAGGHLFHRERFRARARQESGAEEKRRLATFALRENLILERYYPETLAASRRQLAPEERRWLEEHGLEGTEFESAVSDWVITAFDETEARWVLLVLLAGLICLDRRYARQLSSEGPRG